MFASTLCPSLSINHIPSFSIPDIRSFNNHSCIFHLYYLLQYSPLPHLPAVHFSSSIFNLACISVIQHDFQMGAWSGLHDHVLNFGTSCVITVTVFGMNKAAADRPARCQLTINYPQGDMVRVSLPSFKFLHLGYFGIFCQIWF